MKGATVGGVAAVLSDFDEHRSKFGKLIYPISYTINKYIGHRTFTHSLLFLAIIGGIFVRFFNSWVYLSVIAGVLVHIIGDMLTGKVKLLYPWNKSFGITVSPFIYKLIDRITRFFLVVYLFLSILSALLHT